MKMDRTEWNLEQIKYEKYIQELLNKKDRTEEEEEELEQYYEDEMRSQFTIVGGF